MIIGARIEIKKGAMMTVCLRLGVWVIIFFFVHVWAFAETSGGAYDATTPAVEDPKPKNQIATVCAVAQFGDPKVPGTPLFPVGTSALAQDAQGNIYSTTSDGGKYRKGAAYKVTPDGTMTVLYDFGPALKNYPKKDPKDPDVYLYHPSGGLVAADDNNFIGVSGGGALGVGAIFSIPASGGEPTILWSFRNGYPTRKLNPGEKDYTPKEKLDWAASYPMASPVKSGGCFYGVTPYANNQGYGVFYALNGGYEGKYYFWGENGFRPWTMIAGDDGQLFGITAFGRTKGTAYMGTVFAAGSGGGSNIASSSGGTSAASSGGVVSSRPVAMIARASGAIGQPSSPSSSFGGGGVKFLHEGAYDTGYAPQSLVFASDKKLYVAMAGGGPALTHGFGLIARIDPQTGQYEVIHEFDGTNGWHPVSLVEGSDKKLYGTTLGGGHCGTFFSLSPETKKFKMLFKFDHNRIGHRPKGPLLVDRSGQFIYGTTYQVSQYGGGSLYRVDLHLNEPLSRPLGRPCCALGFSQNGLDPAKLGPHIYGNPENKDTRGYVYTAKGGLVDIGHLRDLADMTYYIYQMLSSGEREFNLIEGRVKVTASDSILDQNHILELAGAIAYVESWAHELSTWGTVRQDFSAFSPEDVSSNIMGIEMGKRAILAGCNFNSQMETAINDLLKQLGVFEGTDRTNRVLASVTGNAADTDQRKGKWYASGQPLRSLSNPFATMLLRRNFGGSVWLVDPDNPKGNVSVPTVYNPGRYEKYFGEFTYVMFFPVENRQGVTLEQMPKVTKEIKDAWVNRRENQGMADWP